MKITNSIKLTFIALFALSFINAQETGKCGQPEAQQLIYQNDPALEIQRQKHEKFVNNFLKTYDKNAKETYIIPVVVHVVHSYGEENVSKEKVHAMIDQLNADFSATNDDIDDVIPEFVDIIGNAQLEFRLARLDPEGNCTEGITRHYRPDLYSISSGSNQVALEIPNWTPTKYLNIWTVGDIAGSVLAWSYIPPIYSYLDGLVTEYEHIGTTGNSRHTITHEIGHWLSLYHPWTTSPNASDPGLPENCNYDDLVDDTPNTVGIAFHCDLDFESCGSLDNVQNIMDYTSCDRMLTEGQVARMHALLNSSTNGRNNLWTESNLLATGVSDNYTADPCAPIADFGIDNADLQGCENTSVEFTDLSYDGAVETRTWTFEGGNPATSSDSLVEIVYENPGIYDVSLTVSNASGENTMTKTDYVKIIDTYAGYSIPMLEEFEDDGFPENTDDETKSWTIEAGSTQTWHYTEDASVGEGGSIRIKNQLIGNETINELISPNINLRDFTPESITFNLAFAKRSSNSNGELKVYISKNCGKNWQLVYFKSGAQLVTNGGDNVSGDFIPTADEWSLETISNATFAEEEHIMIKFVNESLGGNFLYIDNVSINKVVGVEEIDFKKYIKNFTIYPNPFHDYATINYTLTQSQPVTIEVFSIIGELLGSYEALQNAGSYSINTNDFVPAIEKGVYLIKLSAHNRSISRRLIKF